VAGKYAKLVKTLPKFQGRDAQAQRIAALTDTIKQEPGFVQHASALAATYTKLRAMRKLLDHVESSLELRTAAIEQIALDQFENEATLSIKLAEGVVMFEEAMADLVDEIMAVQPHELQLNLTPTVYYQPEAYCEVFDKDQFRQWCIENGLADKLQLWPTTMASITRERLLAGDTEPDGVKASNKPKLTF
jgi:hypothetical protein